VSVNYVTVLFLGGFDGTFCIAVLRYQKRKLQNLQEKLGQKWIIIL